MDLNLRLKFKWSKKIAIILKIHSAVFMIIPKKRTDNLKKFRVRMFSINSTWCDLDFR